MAIRFKPFIFIFQRPKINSKEAYLKAYVEERDIKALSLVLPSLNPKKKEI